jgi:hypothetical protein
MLADEVGLGKTIEGVKMEDYTFPQPIAALSGS